MTTGLEDRQYWLQILTRLSEPVLGNLAKRQLRANMPVRFKPGSFEARDQFAHLEAFGRLLCGIAPWLALENLSGEEEVLRARFADLARQSLEAGVDPHSPDFLNFSSGMQPIVDAAFLAQAILRAPSELLDPLSADTRCYLAAAFRATRTRKPGPNNWLLFAACIEAALCKMSEPDWDPMRIDYALRQHEQWYLGDGIYGDGPEFHWDYYNSYVIQPMMIDILNAVGERWPDWALMPPVVLDRARRYAAIQERLIAPDGTFPPIGRSLVYRFGAFQSLAQIALLKELPDEVPPAQARSALTAIIHRTMDAPGTFDENGWLNLGFAGHQPDIAEHYISTGSLYLCAAGLLPLGLPPADPFWADAPRDWTSKRVWSGEDLPPDHALHHYHP